MGGKEPCLCDSDFPEPSASAICFPRRTKYSTIAANQIFVRAAASPPSYGPGTFQGAQSPSPAQGELGLNGKPQNVGGSCDLLGKYQGVLRVGENRWSLFLFHRDGSPPQRISPVAMAEPRLTSPERELRPRPQLSPRAEHTTVPSPSRE